MSDVVNDRDVLLTTTSSRLNAGGVGVIVVPSSPTIKFATDGTANPSSVTFTATKLSVVGDLTWTCVGGVLTGSDPLVRTLNAADMTADTATVTVKVTYGGIEHTNSTTVHKVRDGVVAYTWIKYADTATGTGLSDDPTGKAYIGLAHNKPTATESTNPADYTWSLIKGTDGVPGEKGADGTTYYTWIKYSDNPDGTGLYDIPTSSTIYIGIATNKTTATESTNKADYTWSRFRGSDGVGTPGTRGAGHYYATGSDWLDTTANTATPGGNVVDDVVTISNGTNFVVEKKWSGSAWVPMGTVIDGKLIVTNSITTSKLNTNGLVVRDANGNVILDAGGLRSGFEAPGTINNYIDLKDWRRGSMPSWTPNSESNAIFAVSPSGTPDFPTPTWPGIPGPKGDNDLVWYCQEQGISVQQSGTGQGGGWDAPNALRLDPTKTYRFVVPIRRLSRNGQAYWGPQANTVCALNGTSPHANPYFASMSGLSSDRWYLFIGYIYPAGSQGNTNDNAGVWDCKTGQKVLNGENFCFLAANAGVTGHRAYQYYADHLAEQIFGRPMVNLVDGTEPSIREYFAPGAVMNTAISISPSGVLQGAGGGQVTLPGMGLNTYRIVAHGYQAPGAKVPVPSGFYINGSYYAASVRSYSLLVLRRSDLGIQYHNTYDVYANGAVTAGRNGASLASDLNFFADQGPFFIVVVWTHDEPYTNRMSSGLPAAMYRNGASRAVFGSPNFKLNAAYCLIGISGCGEGNGAESYQGSVNGDPEAIIDVSFQMRDGELVSVSQQFTPKSLQDYGFVGHMDATKGAPAGTYVGDTLAETVTANSWYGKSAYDSVPGINSALGDKLSKTAGQIMTGYIALQSGGGIVSGSLSWNSAGLRIGGSGTAMTPYGLFGHNGTKYTFTIDSATGKAVFADELAAAYGTFGGLRIANGGYIANGNYTGAWAWPAAHQGGGFVINEVGILMGNANNPEMGYIYMDGTTGRLAMPGFDYSGRQLTLTNPILIDPQMNTFTVSVVNTVGQYYWSASRTYDGAWAGAYVATASGQTGAEIYNWRVETFGGTPRAWLNSTTAKQVEFYVYGNGYIGEKDFQLICTVTRNGISSTTIAAVTVNFT